ncbi:MAG: hypothetical protein ACOVLB_02680 [Candidatus Nanopelagicus sp.]
MPVFTAIAAAVTTFAGAVGFSAAAAATIGAVGAFAARTLLTIGITKLLANRSGTTAAGAQDAGARVQLPPSTNNVLPVVYGSAFVAPTIVDAKISSDQKTMWYVCALSEVTDVGAMSYGDIYYNGSLVTFDTTDPAKIVKLTNNANPPQEDTKIDGSVYMYLFANGSSSGVNTGGQTAIQIMSDANIPVDERWNSALYTAGGTTASMTKTAFVIVKINYNQNSGFTSIGQINVQLKNSLTKPGDVFLDYMTNSRYGCALPLDQVDLHSLIKLITYSDVLIPYHPVGYPTVPATTQVRYRINGPINTGQSCLNNLQVIADSCDSWLQYSELTGKWKIVINQSYADYSTIANLYHVDSYNLIGGIDVNPIDLNSTYNSLEVQYPDANIKDQTNYKTINLIDYVPEVMSPNEPANKLIIQFPIVNNYIQALYLGERRMLQSREDLVISFALDYSGIQIEAGDVIRVTLNEYGWNAPTFPDGKLFRVTQVQETKDDSGFLGSRVTASEYNNTIYANNPVQDFIPEANTGLADPNIFDRPSTPIIANGPVANGSINYYSVSSRVPTVGSTLYMDFNIGSSANLQTHKSYASVQVGDGTPYTGNSTITINVADNSPGTYYWSATARNEVAGRQSNSSVAFTWNGPSVSIYNPDTGLGGISYNNINGDVYGISRIIGGVNFAIPNNALDTVTPPVPVSSTTKNIPVTIPSTTIVSTNNYPPFQNTSSDTATPVGNAYYQMSSTGSYGPAKSWKFAGDPGSDHWYVLLQEEFGAGSIYRHENMRAGIGMTFVSDGPAKIQIAQGYLEDGVGYYITDMTKMATFYLPEANNPIQVVLDQVWLLGNGAKFMGTQLICRNINDGASYGGNVTLVSGSLSVQAAKNPYV